jgi:thioredoxin 1
MFRFLKSITAVMATIAILVSMVVLVRADRLSDFGIYDDRPLWSPGLTIGPLVIDSLNVPVLESLDEATALSNKTGQPLLVIAGAKWCSYCHKLKRDIQSEPLRSLTDRFIVVYIDIEQNPDFAAKYLVRSIPHSFIMKHGRVLSSQKGYTTSNYRVWLIQNQHKSMRVNLPIVILDK